MKLKVLIFTGALLIFGGIGATEGDEGALVPGSSKELTTGKNIDVNQHKNILFLPTEEECGFADKEDVAISMQQSGIKLFLTKPNLPSKYPWMVRVVVEDSKGVRWPVCSGTLISSRYVLTSATCLIGLNSAVKVSNIVLGGHNAHCDSGKCFPVSKVVEVSDTVTHPDYVLPTRQHDIGLVKLAKSVTESYMRPICLPKTEALFAGFKNNKTVSVSWGKLEEGSLASSFMLFPRNLRVTEMTFELREYCDRFYKISHAKFGAGRFCATSTASKGVCADEDGGPLLKSIMMPESDQSRIYQIGIASFQHKLCGQPGIPAGFTNVINYMSWILDNMSLD